MAHNLVSFLTIHYYTVINCPGREINTIDLGLFISLYILKWQINIIPTWMANFLVNYKLLYI